jgi:dephospho-CoA kinase
LIPLEDKDGFDFPWLKRRGLLVLGVTGGVASGKTTVANMLMELGAPIVDLDLIARQVVAPGKPAWKDIRGYFGDKVIRRDGTIDRKQLSGIVFRDPSKRKKLENFTHPPILEGFARQVTEIMEKNLYGIIQAVIPLLFEVNLQHLVHKILVVYIPPHQQVERLAKRDKISKKEAENILKSQMPIDKKLKCADFVIHNEGSLDKTRGQVNALWKKLKESLNVRAGSIV